MWLHYKRQPCSCLHYVWLEILIKVKTDRPKYYHKAFVLILVTLYLHLYKLNAFVEIVFVCMFQLNHKTGFN
jgi:hypothetical protein